MFSDDSGLSKESWTVSKSFHELMVMFSAISILDQNCLELEVVVLGRFNFNCACASLLIIWNLFFLGRRFHHFWYKIKSSILFISPLAISSQLLFNSCIVTLKTIMYACRIEEKMLVSESLNSDSLNFEMLIVFFSMFMQALQFKFGIRSIK